MDDLKKDPFEEYKQETEPGKRERYESWRTAIGLQAVDALIPSNYLLETAKRHIEGELSIDQVKALISSYYEENPKHDKDGSKEADMVSARIEEVLNEKNELHNREMHISGAFQKQDIEDRKQDIEDKKQDIEQDYPYIDALYAAGFKAKSLRHTEKLYGEFGRERIFGRGDAVEILGITPSPASALLKRLLEAGIIVSVSGAGKGKYRFKP